MEVHTERLGKQLLKEEKPLQVSKTVFSPTLPINAQLRDCEKALIGAVQHALWVHRAGAPSPGREWGVFQTGSEQ